MATFLDSLAAGRTPEGFDPDETELLLRAAVDLLPQEPAMRVSEWLDGATWEPGDDSFDFDFGTGSEELATEVDAGWLTDFGDGTESPSNPLEDDEDLGEWDDSWSLASVADPAADDDPAPTHHHEADLGHDHDLGDVLDLTEDHGPRHHDD